MRTTVHLPLASLFLALTASSALSAPAPLPRPQREKPAVIRDRQLAESFRKLNELGVKWEKEFRGGQEAIRFTVRHPNQSSTMGGLFPVNNGDVLKTLEAIIKRVEAFIHSKDRW